MVLFWWYGIRAGARAKAAAVRVLEFRVLLGCLPLQVGRLGIGICYDIRFPEMAQLYAARGVQLIVYPGECRLHGALPGAAV